ncbi:MAG: hypothetical protein ABEI27_01945 [Halobellus sp.]|uniref:hypothetical protein n=1 Tax=Halobellus sp. TaxID=1979212 RepID=UPI0035D4B011
MSIVESLPPRPLSPEELLQLNAAEVLELAVPIEDEGLVSGVLVATDVWVKGLALDAEEPSWTVLETVALDDETERVDGLQACEAVILRARGEDPETISPADAPGSYEPAVPAGEDDPEA